MIDAVDRAPTRILKSRDLAEAPPRAESLVGLTAGPRAPSVNAPGSSAAAHTGAKEVRLLPGENGTSALEVRCSCGELTRVELQLGGNAKPEGVR